MVEINAGLQSCCKTHRMTWHHADYFRYLGTYMFLGGERLYIRSKIIVDNEYQFLTSVLYTASSIRLGSASLPN